MAKPTPARLSRQDARRFGLMVGAAFLLLGGLAWWRGREVSASVLGGIGALLMVLGVLTPGALAPVFRAWMGVATVLSRITTPLLLALVYFGLITPIGILRRLAGKGRLASSASAGSFWVSRAGQPVRREQMERQF